MSDGLDSSDDRDSRDEDDDGDEAGSSDESRTSGNTDSGSDPVESDEQGGVGDETGTGSRSLPACPRCGGLVVAVVTSGPETHVTSPCGCRLGRLEADGLR